MTTVLGRTVSGEITRNEKRNRKPQRPGEELLPLLDSVLAVPNVHSVRWTQYTPYFNDGDACIFGVNEIRVRLSDSNPNAGDEEDGYLGEWDMKDYSSGYKQPVPVKPEFEDLYPAFMALEDQMECFEDFVRESFGDHAEVTATTTGFEVEFYEHD
jgi:hypothetical protein